MERTQSTAITVVSNLLTVPQTFCASKELLTSIVCFEMLEAGRIVQVSGPDREMSSSAVILMPM